jgi:hypothetical protein
MVADQRAREKGVIGVIACEKQRLINNRFRAGFEGGRKRVLEPASRLLPHCGQQRWPVAVLAPAPMAGPTD